MSQEDLTRLGKGMEAMRLALQCPPVHIIDLFKIISLH